jgi:hypothetical protein
MRFSLHMSRVFVFIAVVGVAIAVWTALGVVGAQPPPLIGDEVSVSQAELDRVTGDMLDSRNRSLDAVGSSVESTRPGEGRVAGADFSNRGNLDLAGSAVRANLENRGSRANEAGAVPPAPILDPLLDRADVLYRLASRVRTLRTAVTYQDSMTREAPFYFRFFEFRSLRARVERDILSYRQANSLALNEFKATLYQTESDTNRERVAELRDEATASVEKESKTSLAHDNALLDEIASSAVAEWTPPGTVESGAQLSDAFSILFLDRLASIGKQVFVSDYAPLTMQEQSPETTSWIPGEREFDRKLVNVLEGIEQ